MSEEYRFEVNVSGDGITPESLTIKDIVNVLVSVEKIVDAVVSHNRPDLVIEKQNMLRLSSLTEGSLNFAYSTPYKETGPALKKVGDVAEEGDSTHLPTDARIPVLELLKFSKDHHSNIEFREVSKARPRLALLTPETVISAPPESALIAGKTTLYGELRRIGGDQPKAHIRLFTDGNIHGCDVSTPELAREIAQHLYKTIGVRGSAKWEVETMKLHSFCIEELTPYRQTTLTEAFDSLSEVAAKHYADLEDVDAFVADLRGQMDSRALVEKRKSRGSVGAR